jgi:argininosuccinate lyase
MARLARPQDVEQSRAHARALRELDVLTDDELKQIDQGLQDIADELAEERFKFADDDEDVHMAIERRLTELIGTVGGKLHTARSRNDQVATDLAMFVRVHAERAGELVRALMARLLGLAERHRDWAMPGYTHMQRAQTVYLGHHLLAYFWMFRRDALRLGQVAAEAGEEMPAGSGALAGVNWDLDRERIADALGFASVSQNSLDAVSNRDFALAYLAAASVCATHLSRLGAEVVLWSSSEFDFCEPAESFSSGSSIMPQKKNPDAAELLRAKAPRVAAAFATLNGAIHALPLAYSKDLQEDKEPLFDAADSLELCLEAADHLLGGLRFHRERLAAAAADELLAATDLADLLVREGMPFREAHEAVGGVVRSALERGKSLSELGDADLDSLPPGAVKAFRELLRSRGWVDSKVSAGGTGADSVKAQLKAAQETLRELGS